MKHIPIVHTHCIRSHCPICDGALIICAVCGGAESSLTTDCFGKKIPSWLEQAVTYAYIDFVDGKWVITERGKAAGG